MGFISSALDYMSTGNKLPLTLVLILLPTVFTIFSFAVILGAPIDFTKEAIVFIMEIIFLAVTSFSLFLLLKLFKGKGKFDFKAIFARNSLRFIPSFILGFSFLLAMFAVVPDLPSVAKSLSSSANQDKLLSLINGIGSSGSAGTIALALQVLGVIVLALSGYMIYKTIADYSKSGIAKNIAIFLLFTIVAFFFNYLI